MWKIEVLVRRNCKILILLKDDPESEHDMTRGSVEVYDDAEYEKWLKVLELLNNNN